VRRKPKGAARINGTRYPDRAGYGFCQQSRDG
jgi:hypothetical protein